MFRMQPDEYFEDEEFDSDTPEAINEHKDADIGINDHMDQRLLSVNRMGYANKYNNGEKRTSVEEFEHGEDMLKYYRSKSQNLSKPIDKEVHPKSQISSPVEASSSTIRNQSTNPTSLHAETGDRNFMSKKDSYSSIKKSKRTITKTYCKMSSIEHNSANWASEQNKDISNILARSKLVHMNSDSRTGAIGQRLSTIKSRPSQSIIHGTSVHAQSQLENSVSKLKGSSLNESASTSVLRTNHSIINIRGNKENLKKN